MTRVVDSPLCHLEAAWKTSDQHHSSSARASGERVSSLLMNTVSGWPLWCLSCSLHQRPYQGLLKKDKSRGKKSVDARYAWSMAKKQTKNRQLERGLSEDEQHAKGLKSSSCLNTCGSVQHCSLLEWIYETERWGIYWASSTHVYTSAGSKISVTLESTAVMYREQGELGGLSQAGNTKGTIPVVQENGLPVKNGIYSRKNMCIYMAYYKYLSISIEMCKHTNIKAL